MRKYNDFEQRVYQYLRNYSRYQYQIKSIDMEAAGVREQIKELGGLKAVAYDAVPASGGEKTSSVEATAIRAEKLENRLHLLAAERERITTLLARIDGAMEMLDAVDRKILTLRHIQGARWLQVSMDVPYSEHNCQIRADKAVQRLATILFPVQDDGAGAFYPVAGQG